MADKSLSTIIEFDIRSETSGELGISEKVAKRVSATEIPYVVCPLCAMNRILDKSGRYFLNRAKKKEIDKNIINRKLREGLEIKSPRSKKYNLNKDTRFNTFDLKNSPFISLRKSHGRGGGIEEVRIIKFSDIEGLPSFEKNRYKNLMLELREQCQRILDYTEQFI